VRARDAARLENNRAVRLHDCPPSPWSGRALVPILATWPFLHCSVIVMHLAIGTPELFLTLLPGFVIGTVYVTIYTMALARSARHATVAPCALSAQGKGPNITRSDRRTDAGPVTAQPRLEAILRFCGAVIPICGAVIPVPA